MTTPDSHIPNSNAYPGGGNWGVQSYVPAPQGVPRRECPYSPYIRGCRRAIRMRGPGRRVGQE